MASSMDDTSYRDLRTLAAAPTLACENRLSLLRAKIFMGWITSSLQLGITAEFPRSNARRDCRTKTGVLHKIWSTALKQEYRTTAGVLHINRGPHENRRCESITDDANHRFPLFVQPPEVSRSMSPALYPHAFKFSSSTRWAVPTICACYPLVCLGTVDPAPRCNGWRTLGLLTADDRRCVRSVFLPLPRRDRCSRNRGPETERRNRDRS